MIIEFIVAVVLIVGLIWLLDVMTGGNNEPKL